MILLYYALSAFFSDRVHLNFDETAQQDSRLAIGMQEGLFTIQCQAEVASLLAQSTFNVSFIGALYHKD
jgi:hypothetical protein